MSEWQPISTAPKDGSDLWLYCAADEPSQFVGYWCDESDGDNSGFWQYREHLVAEVVGMANPTHWMPLPPPPARDE